MFWKRSVPEKTPRCSFCHKAKDAVGDLISAPSNDFRNGIYICRECVAVCNDILADRHRDKDGHLEDAAGDSDAPPAAPP